MTRSMHAYFPCANYTPACFRVLKSERPDVDKKRSDLLKLQGEFAVRLRHLEKALLTALNEAKGWWCPVLVL